MFQCAIYLDISEEYFRNVELIGQLDGRFHLRNKQENGIARGMYKVYTRGVCARLDWLMGEMDFDHVLIIEPRYNRRRG